MPQLTQKEYKCSHCGETRQLVIRRGRAYLCGGCDKEVLAERRAKSRALRELNKIAEEILAQ